jgi:hypothetical protein
VRPGQQGVELVVRLPQQRAAGVVDVDRVHVLEVRIDGGVVEDAERRQRETLLVQHVSVRQVEDAGVVHGAGDDAQRRGLAEREVQRDVGVPVLAIGAAGLAEGGFRPSFEFAQHRTPRHIADGTTQRTRTVQRALRSAQHLDAFDVLEQQVGINRRVVEVG